MRLLSSLTLVIISFICLGSLSVYGQNNSITMSLGTATANCGEQVCINVTTQDFDNVLTFQYIIGWDAALLGVGSVDQFGIADLGPSNFNTTESGMVRIGWDDSTLRGVSLPDNSVLFQLCFDTPDNLSGTSIVQFVEAPVTIEIIDIEGNELTPNFQDGSITLNCVNGPDNPAPPPPPTAPANLGLSVSNATGSCGTQTCVEVSAIGFTDVFSFQHSLNWDLAQLGTGQVTSFGLTDLDDSNFNLAIPGQLRVAWDDSSLSGLNLQDNFVLYQVCFDVPASASGVSSVALSNVPLAIEVTDLDGNAFTPSLQNGSITISCGTNTDDTNTDDTNTDNPATSLNISASSTTVVCGGQTCVDVTANGFTDVLAFQYSMNWDAILLGTATLQNFGLAGLSASNFNTTFSGLARVGWDDASLEGITVPDGQVLFQICFTASSGATRTSPISFSDNPTPIEIIDTNGNSLNPIFTDGSVSVVCDGTDPTPTTPTNPPTNTDLSLRISNATGTCGSQVCVDVSTAGFTGIVAFQHSLNWDATQLGTATISQVGLADLGTPNFNTTTAGQLRVGWDDSSLQGISVSDNHVLYQVCFDASATANGTLPIQFSNTPIGIEVINNNNTAVLPALQDGSVAITCTTNGGGNENSVSNTPLSMRISDATGTCGSQVCVDVSTAGFTGIAAFQHSLNWDAAQLGTATISQVGLADLGTPNFNTTTAGQLRVGWDDSSLQGISVSDNHVLYQVCFDASATANGTLPIQFSNTPIGIEVINNNNTAVLPTLQDGSVAITCGTVGNPTTPPASTGPLGFSVDDASRSCGDQVCLDVRATGFEDILTFQYTMRWDPAILGNARVGQYGIPDLVASNFNNNTEGILRIGWDDTFISGVTLPDNSTLFQVCFDALAVNASTNVEFIGTPTSIEVVNMSGQELTPTFRNSVVSVTCANTGGGDINPDNPLDTDGAVNFTIADVTATCDGPTCLDVTVKNFEDILSFQYTIVWDPLALGTASIRQFNLSHLDENSFNASTVGQLRVGWVDNFLSGLTLADDAVIYQICFNEIGDKADRIELRFENSPTSIEITNKNGAELIPSFTNGSVLINCSSTTAFADNDGDGFTADVDCDDNNASINPGATEFPNNGVDEDCDGIAQFFDADNDGFNSSIDCDDNNPNINGRAVEIPDNGIDEDCDGTDLVTVASIDNDGDGFTADVDCDDTNAAINPSAAEIANSGFDENCDGVSLLIDVDNDGFNSSIDCDDNNPNINGRATEIPNNGIDENCDGADLITTVLTDNDNDGFQSDVDCNDNNAAINPGATEIANSGFDENCDGISLIIDADNDGFNSSIDCDDNNPNINGRATEIPNNGIDENCDGADLVTTVLTDNDNDGFQSDVDCNDNNAAINPGATEIANSGFDENCDGVSLLIDADNDGFNSSIDCDDNNASVNSNATEIPNNGIDEDCDGADLITTVFTDNDNDGFQSDVDCDDNNAAINPGATEIANSGFDENCDGVSLIIDADNDGFNSSIDCDDNNASVNSSATEIPNNGIDEDCDGADLITTVFTDNDNDGFQSDVDCNDNNAAINPGATEIANSGFDENCDGVSLVIDADNDGFNSSIDCDDNNASVNSSATEIPNNGIDEDCDGTDLVTAIDNDGDGFTADVDCDDNNPNINPGIKEIENNAVDEDCDGIISVIDNDNDGFNSDDDCNDSDPMINPSATDIPNNGIDENCNGSDMVTPSGESTIKMLLSSGEVKCGEQICLEVVVRDFDNIIAFQYTINWNADHLGAASVQNFGLSDLGSSNFNSSVPGQLRVGWDDSSIQGVSLPDDIILFELCFSSVSSTSVNSTISFSSNPLPIEIVTGEGVLGTFEFQEGVVVIDCSGLSDFQEEEDRFYNTQQLNNTRIVLGTMDVYPNPTQSMLYVEVEENLPVSGAIRIFDIGGNIVSTKIINENVNRWQVPVQSLVAGLYFVEIQAGDKIYRDRFTRL